MCYQRIFVSVGSAFSVGSWHCACSLVPLSKLELCFLSFSAYWPHGGGQMERKFSVDMTASVLSRHCTRVLEVKNYQRFSSPNFCLGQGRIHTQKMFFLVLSLCCSGLLQVPQDDSVCCLSSSIVGLLLPRVER